MAMRIETITTDAFSMDYFKFGQGEDALVILPGLSVQSVMGFADAIADAYHAFFDGYTVYVFDRRRELPDAYPVHEMAKDTADAISALGLEKVNLFGASQGGMIAMLVAIERPDLVRKLALGSTASRMEQARYEAIEGWIKLAKAKDRKGLYLAFGEAIYPKDMLEQSKDLLIEVARTVTDEDLDRFVILAQGLEGFDATEGLAQIACPVLIIGSEDDRVLGPDASRQIKEGLNGQADVTLHMYDGYGHAAYDVAPDYKDRLLSFFSS